MRLSVHDRSRLPDNALQRTYICGQDELPHYCRAYESDGQILIERADNESGTVHVLWEVDGHGQLMLSTATLMEREEPYQLEVELARGSVNQLRNQLAHWEMLGLVVPDTLRDEVRQASQHFFRAVTRRQQPDEAARRAAQSLSQSLTAMNNLAGVYATQAMGIRRGQNSRLNALMGVGLGPQMPELALARQLPSAFNFVSIGLSWRDVETSEARRDWSQAERQCEWAQSAGLKVAAGPLLQLHDRGVPDWSYLWEGDFDSLRTFMLDHVRKCVRRFRGKVQLWQLASRVSLGGALALSEEQRLQIVAQAIGVVREQDARVPIVVTFDQPWAEYLATQQLDLAPLHFADALVRAELGLSGLGIELNLGYHPRATSHHNALAYNRLIDEWSLLELPLLVSLTVPSDTAKDPLADSRIRTDRGASLEGQREWIEEFLPLLLAKNSVQVILWNQLSDAVPHEFPHGGLFDGENQAKPALAALTKVRGEYLM